MTASVARSSTSRGQLAQSASNTAVEPTSRERGAVFTNRVIAEFILDMVGYTSENNLLEYKLLEPSFGTGEFLIPAVQRLMSSCREVSLSNADIVRRLYNCIQAVEVHKKSYDCVWKIIVGMLSENGISKEDAEQITDSWLLHGDFLLAEFSGGFTHIVGNPPFVRNELIPAWLWQEYTSRYSTAGFRADLSALFIERALQLLGSKGELAFITADRWTKNQYGAELRSFISNGYHLKALVNIQDCDAFQARVNAYPVIVVVGQGKEISTSTKVVSVTTLDTAELQALAHSVKDRGISKNQVVREITTPTPGSQPWLMELSEEELALVRRIEGDFVPLEEVGCKVSIGAATGCDRVYIGTREELPVESELLLPLVNTADIYFDQIDWKGKFLINPFASGGGLVDLRAFPRFAQHLMVHKEVVHRRHIARSSPNSWYRTIDRIYPILLTQPKLLIPDIRNRMTVVFDEGQYYPHHNLYFVTAREWDIRALQAVLRSNLSWLFLKSYAVRMRGGYVRCQAQYVRRIRVPHWNSVSVSLRTELREAGENNDLDACNWATAELYGLNRQERAVLQNKT